MMHRNKGLYCYDDILNFALSNESCEFDITNIDIIMQGKSSPCSEKCLLLSTDMHIYQSFYFRVTSISVTLHIKRDKYTFPLEAHHCSEKEINEMRLHIVCGSLVRSGESFIACNKEVGCLDDRAVCETLTHEGQGRCVCKDNSMLIKGQICDCKERQIRYEDTCLDGNLSVGQECFRSSQCTDADPAVRCVDGHCLCMEGYQMRGQKCVEDTNEENTKTQTDISIIAGVIGYFLGLTSTVCASLIFKKCWKRSIKTRHRNTSILQNGSNLALQSELYKHPESAVFVGELPFQLQEIRKSGGCRDDPYSKIEETNNHQNDNNYLTPNNEVNDFARQTEVDQAEDMHTVAKALPSTQNECHH